MTMESVLGCCVASSLGISNGLPNELPGASFQFLFSSDEKVIKHFVNLGMEDIDVGEGVHFLHITRANLHKIKFKKYLKLHEMLQERDERENNEFKTGDRVVSLHSPPAYTKTEYIVMRVDKNTRVMDVGVKYTPGQVVQLWSSHQPMDQWWRFDADAFAKLK